MAHGKSVKKPDVARGLSEEWENMQDTSKVSAGTMGNFRLQVQERLCDTGIVQGKVSRMTSPMRQKGDGFATTAK